MCGIIAYTGQQQALPILLEGLRRLEYRGYDSSGIALQSRKKLRVTKKAGKLSVLESNLNTIIKSNSGIGHTRWATHGEPNDLNAHPHVDSEARIALVHNGIIENATTIRAQLLANGTLLTSETDTELLAHLIAEELDTIEQSKIESTKDNETSLTLAVRTVLQGLIGTYGLAVIDRNHPDIVVVARNGSPVILGIGEDEMLAASDASALLRHTSQLIHLEDGEIAELTPRDFKVTLLDATPTTKIPTTATDWIKDYDRGDHAHYLRREIMDQPETLTRTFSGRLEHRFATSRLDGLNLEARDLLNFKRIKILGCGSALYAGMAGAQMIESLARLAVDAESAAEFRYRNPVIEADTLYIVVSQSGETFDTLAALREIKRKGGVVRAIVNSVGSTIAREVDGGVYMHAGPEVSVASTKAYTSMLSVFALLAIQLGRIRDLSPQKGAKLIEELTAIPAAIEQVLAIEEAIAKIARHYMKASSMFFIGRTIAYPIALEGAQKLKEISYIHAEAYPASELKHGPLALLTKQTPCLVVLPDTELLQKSIGSLEEVKARSAPVIVVSDLSVGKTASETGKSVNKIADHLISVPAVDELFKPIVMAVALQLFAYHSAVGLGRDVDQPRNLAKSVTVE